MDSDSTVRRRTVQRVIGWLLVVGCTGGGVRHMIAGGEAVWLSIWGFYAVVGAVILWWASMQAREQREML